MNFLKKYRFGILALAVVAAVGMVACDSSTTPANQAEQNVVQNQQDIYNKNQPLPVFQYSNERELLIQIYQQRTTGNLNTWTVWISNNGVPLGMCPSKGFPLPYSTELSNPDQVSRDSVYTGGAPGTVGQMDPNGLYPSGNTLATWVMCIDPDGSVHPQYIEPMVMTFTYPVAIQNGQIVKLGNSTSQSKVTITQK